MPESAETDLAAVEPWDQGPPRINCPRAFGAGVGSPFIFPIAATGERPLEFRVEGLPQGLYLDAPKGVIRGAARNESDTVINITVRNAHGSDSREVRIVIGGRLALTPPMGWNSYNAWDRNVDADKVRAAADAMVSSGLAARGYAYVNIDDAWQGPRGGAFGAIQGNGKFPDMRALCGYVHDRGLRIGLYSTPWVKSYDGCTGGSCRGTVCGESDTPQLPLPSAQPSAAGLIAPAYCPPTSPEQIANGRYIGCGRFEREDAQQWAAWGVDYLKYDWHPMDVASTERMREALRACGRDIVFSLSNNAPFSMGAEWAKLANCWRTTGDIHDRWEGVCQGFGQDHWIPFAGPGHWNDPDMLVLGRVGWGQPRENRLTRDEQITHITLWTILAAPLLIGCDLTQLDDLTIRLLSNEEVLAIDQDPLGNQGHCLRDLRCTADDGAEIRHESIYVRDLSGGAKAVALFNRSTHPDLLEVTWADLGITGARRVRDLWARHDLGRISDRFAVGVPAHGAQYIRLDP